MTRVKSLAYWLTPPLLCLILYWQCATSWFRTDDLAWLAFHPVVSGFRDLLSAIFAPLAQGTIRPWSERLPFLVLPRLFGLSVWPFRLLIFATHFANLGLVAVIGRKIAGSRAAGWWSAVLWTINSGLMLPLGWVCVYNEVLCGFFLLLAFQLLLRYIETGETRYNVLQWMVFLLGFGALETNLVYPALATAYVLCCAPKCLRRVLPLFTPSIVFVLLHLWAAPIPNSGPYVMHFTGSMFHTLFTYWTWSLGSTYLRAPIAIPLWILPLGVAAVSVGILAFAIGHSRLGTFSLIWYVVTIAPVLPLRDHQMEYYIYLPLIGVCWLAGAALIAAWRAGGSRRIAAVVLAAIYILMTAPEGWAIARWNHDLTARLRDMVLGVRDAHARAPAQTILLVGVDDDLFNHGIVEQPFRLVGADAVFLAPETHVDGAHDSILPAAVVSHALEHGELAVYDVSGAFREITRGYAALPRDARLPQRVDAGIALTSFLLGPEWYNSEGRYRWMARRATLRMGAPEAPGRQLVVSGFCPAEQVPVTLTITVNGIPLPSATISHDREFQVSYALPESIVGQGEMTVAVDVNHTFVPQSAPRELGLAFGVFEVR